MWIDPLVEEVRQRRRKLMADFDYDPQKFLDFLKRERRKYSDRLAYPQEKKLSTNIHDGTKMLSHRSSIYHNEKKS